MRIPLLSNCDDLDDENVIEHAAIHQILAAADFGAFTRAEIDPIMWDESASDLGIELTRAFTYLLDAHRACVTAKRHVLVSIF